MLSRLNLEEFSLEDGHVRKIGDDVVCVVYTGKATVTLDGKDPQIEACAASVRVWQNGKWVCAVQAGSIAGDAFGRH